MFGFTRVLSDTSSQQNEKKTLYSNELTPKCNLHTIGKIYVVVGEEIYRYITQE